jgi:hypothetical protein
MRCYRKVQTKVSRVKIIMRRRRRMRRRESHQTIKHDFAE